jgi:hypothetical protein
MALNKQTETKFYIEFEDGWATTTRLLSIFPVFAIRN